MGSELASVNRSSTSATATATPAATSQQSDIQRKATITVAELDAMQLPMGSWAEDRDLIWMVHSLKHYAKNCPNFDIDGNDRIESVDKRDASGNITYSGDYGILKAAQIGLMNGTGWPSGLHLLEGQNATRTEPWRDSYYEFDRGTFYFDYLNCLNTKNAFDLGGTGNSRGVNNSIILRGSFLGRPWGLTPKTLQSRLAVERLVDNMRICYAYFKLTYTPSTGQNAQSAVRVLQQNCGIAPKPTLRRLPDVTAVSSNPNGSGMTCSYSLSDGTSLLQRAYTNSNAASGYCGDGKAE